MKRGDIQSRTINVMRIILVVYVVMIHSYSGTRGVIYTGQYPVYKATAFFLSLEISQIAVTRTRKVGSSTMLNAENPIFIISGARRT